MVMRLYFRWGTNLILSVTLTLVTRFSGTVSEIREKRQSWIRQMFERWRNKFGSFGRRASEMQKNRSSSDSPREKIPRFCVLMCRYNTGRLQKAEVTVADTDYLAISHVWGDVQWRHIPGIDEEVLVSKCKAKFMAERLASIVGTDWFWMDVLCVDQRNKDARTAITEHIPTIYRHARRTILISESTGFRNCCTKALGISPEQLPVDYFDEGCQYRKRLVEHYKRVHNNDVFLDGITSRLWPYQEIILSDSIQCVRADIPDGTPNKAYTFGHDISNVLNSLRMVCVAWASYGSPRDIDSNFRNETPRTLLWAYLHSGTALRTPASKSPPRFPIYDGFQMQIGSTRRTAKSRDFILATMPQYAFYKVPANAKAMTFAQLFVDAFQQLGAECDFLELSPNLMGPLDLEKGIVSALHHVIPEARVLGDLVKLLYGPRLDGEIKSRRSVPMGQLWGVPVVVTRATGITQGEAIQYINQSIHRSSFLWAAAKIGDLSEMCTGPNEVPLDNLGSSDLPTVAEALYVISLAQGDREYILAVEDYAFRSAVADSVLRLAALITCGFGVLAFEWSKQHLQPVLVKFFSDTFLGLVPYSTLEGDYEFYLVEADRPWAYLKQKRLALVAWNGLEESDSYVLCLFPNDEDWIGRKFWRKWII